MPERRKSTDLDPFISSLLCGAQKRHNPISVKCWEIIADNLSKAGFSWGCSSQIDSTGRELFTADAYSRDGRRFIILSDDKLSAFLELESEIRRLDAFSPKTSKGNHSSKWQGQPQNGERFRHADTRPGYRHIVQINHTSAV